VSSLGETRWRSTDESDSYFKSAFHCFDAAVIIAGFVIDIVLRGPHEEAGSLVVVLRLWRVFKIIEEFSTGANDEMEGLYEHIDKLKEENESMRGENETLRKRCQSDAKVMAVDESTIQDEE
jgi:voltage-gated hydrogen channel 1